MHFGFPGNTATDLGSFYSSSVYCTLANRLENRKVFPRQITAGCETQQCPTGQVAGIPCRGRFNTEWTVKKKTSAFGAVVAWPSGMKPHFLSPEEVGVQFPIRAGLLSFFFPSYFTLWLVAVYSHCWPFLVSREFCDKVFLILIIGCFCCFLLKTRERNNCCKRASISSSRLIWTRLITRIYAV